MCQESRERAGKDTQGRRAQRYQSWKCQGTGQAEATKKGPRTHMIWGSMKLTQQTQSSLWSSSGWHREQITRVWRKCASNSLKVGCVSCAKGLNPWLRRAAAGALLTTCDHPPLQQHPAFPEFPPSAPPLATTLWLSQKQMEVERVKTALKSRAGEEWSRSHHFSTSPCTQVGAGDSLGA